MRRLRPTPRFALTGAQSLQTLLKSEESDAYGMPRPRGINQVPMKATAIDEPGDSAVVLMSEALPPEEFAYYTEESNVVEWSAVNRVAFEEIQELSLIHI